jgi:protease-4
MGNYAASGGYFIAAPATRIYANPTTITGSIGVFGLIPNASTLLNQKLGINTATVKTNTSSDFPSVIRPMSSKEREVMQMSIEHVYSDFVSKVATGRDMSPQAVDSIGEGRVYSGSRGLQIGLVDEIGGLDDAIKGAAELAGLESYSIRELPVPVDPYTHCFHNSPGKSR